MIRHIIYAAVIATASALAGCSSSTTPDVLSFDAPRTTIAYNAELKGVKSEKIVDLMKEALEIYRREGDGAQSVAFLCRRAQGDVNLAIKIMRSFGYFEAAVDVDVDEPEEGVEDAIAVATLIITPGPQYKLAEHRFILTEPGSGEPAAPIVAASVGSPVGKAARAARILAAEQKAVAQLRADGRIYATRLGRDAVADPEADTIVARNIAMGQRHLKALPR
jgi:translocation and assembly module TamA